MGQVPFRTTVEKALPSVYSVLSSQNSLNWPSASPPPSLRPLNFSFLQLSFPPCHVQVHTLRISFPYLYVSLISPLLCLLFLLCLPSPLFILYPLSLKMIPVSSCLSIFLFNRTAILLYFSFSVYQYIFPLSSISLAYFPLFFPFPSDPDSFRQCGVIKNAYRKNPPAQQIYVGLRGTG